MLNRASGIEEESKDKSPCYIIQKEPM